MDTKSKTEYLVTWVVRDKDGNIKEMGNDYPKIERTED
jgi:hypothetical protein